MASVAYATAHALPSLIASREPEIVIVGTYEEAAAALDSIETLASISVERCPRPEVALSIVEHARELWPRVPQLVWSLPQPSNGNRNGGGAHVGIVTGSSPTQAASLIAEHHRRGQMRRRVQLNLAWQVSRQHSLTPTQRVLLELIVLGVPRVDIPGRLGQTPATLRGTRGELYRACDVRDCAELQAVLRDTLLDLLATSNGVWPEHLEGG